MFSIRRRFSLSLGYLCPVRSGFLTTVRAARRETFEGPSWVRRGWPMATVLLVGEDEILLNTRAAVVRTTGASTVCSLTTSALTVLADAVCDRVILCHSVPDYVCSTLVEIIRRHWPDTRILRLAAGGAWEEDDSVAVCSADPETLVQRTVGLLGRRDPQRVPAAECDRRLPRTLLSLTSLLRLLNNPPQINVGFSRGSSFCAATGLSSSSRVLAQHAQHLALDADVCGRREDRSHLLVRRLQPDHRPLAVEALQRRVGSVHQGYDDLAFACGRS